MIRYEVIEETIYTKENGKYKSFGIAAISDEGTDKISDISVSEQNVKNLVMLLNRNNVSIEHFSDIVNDFIAV